MAKRARATSRWIAPEKEIEETLALLEDLRAEVRSFLILGGFSREISKGSGGATPLLILPAWQSVRHRVPHISTIFRTPMNLIP
jgi:hypothetical protein